MLSQVQNCTKEPGSELWNIYCKTENNTVGQNITDCDQYFQTHEVSLRQAIVGLASGEFTCKFFSTFLMYVHFNITFINVKMALLIV